MSHVALGPYRALQGIKAIAFDVQGTCVDFYQPVLRAGAELNRAKDCRSYGRSFRPNGTLSTTSIQAITPLRDGKHQHQRLKQLDMMLLNL